MNREEILLKQHRSFLASVRPKTAIDVLKSPNRSLAFIISEEGNDSYVKAILSILIADTADFLNVGKTISGPQIMQTIELILEDFSIYKIDFFIACFNKAKKGHYGKQYDRLDGQIIFEWLNHYEYEYQLEIEKGRATEKALVEKGALSLSVDQPDQKLIQGKDNTPVPMPANVKQAYLQMLFRPVPVAVMPARTEAQIIIDGFMDDFKILHEASGIPGSVKVVPFYGATGKAMDMNDYLECRALVYEKGLEFNDCLEDCVDYLKKFHQKRFESAKERKKKSWKY